MRRLLLGLALASMLLFASAPAALAKGLADDRVVFGDSVTIVSGETISGNLVVFGGEVTLQDGGRVTGNVVVFGGNVNIDGQVDGDVAVFAGNGRIGDTAVIDGQLVTAGGNLTREQGAIVRGGESRGFEFSPPIVRPTPFDFGFAIVSEFVSNVLAAIALAALALLVLLFWPLQTTRVAEAAQTAPGQSGGLGLLTLIAVPVLLLILAVTICLSPVSAIGALALASAVIFGWIALGLLIGNRLLAALNVRHFTPAVAAGVGTLLISLLAGIFDLIPCVGWLIPILLGAVGLGAVILTRFGTQPYFPGGRPAAPPPSPPTPTEPPLAPPAEAAG